MEPLRRRRHPLGAKPVNRGTSNRAEALHRHRVIFAYAIEHGLSLADAERALVRLAWKAVNERLRVVRAGGRRCGRRHAAAVVDAVEAHGRALGLELPASARTDDAPWMMRD